MANKDSFTSQLKDIIADFYDADNKKVYDEPKCRYIKKELNKNQIRALKDITRVVMCTDIVSDTYKQYLLMRYGTYQDLADEMELKYGANYNTSTLQSRVWTNRNKLVQLYGDKCLSNIILYNKFIDKYNAISREILFKYVGNNNMLNGLCIKIDSDVASCDNITDEQFDDFVDMILPYTKRTAKYLLESLDKEVIGYIKYLMCASDLSDTDFSRYDRLREIIED